MDRDTALCLAVEAARRNYLELGKLMNARFFRASYFKEIFEKAGVEYAPGIVDCWAFEFSPPHEIEATDSTIILEVTENGDVYRLTVGGRWKLKR
ncbi:MAG: hypothetical protein N3A38_17205 [Planctomycetota bacterium]|nr:hypothetical protein [Planctomycetota bacterium]